jgi:hypothetical protein
VVLLHIVVNRTKANNNTLESWPSF